MFQECTCLLHSFTWGWYMLYTHSVYMPHDRTLPAIYSLTHLVQCTSPHTACYTHSVTQSSVHPHTLPATFSPMYIPCKLPATLTQSPSPVYITMYTACYTLTHSTSPVYISAHSLQHTHSFTRPVYNTMYTACYTLTQSPSPVYNPCTLPTTHSLSHPVQCTSLHTPYQKNSLSHPVQCTSLYTPYHTITQVTQSSVLCTEIIYAPA